MDLRQLRYFLAIAQEGQVTAAAKLLNMEQPPLSRQLKMIEDELGVTLFDRSGRRLKLTPAGELLRQRAERLLQQYNETIKEVQELDEGVQGVLSIGAVVSCVSLLPPAIKKFRENYPQVMFKIHEGDHFLLGDQLEKRNIELVVARLPFEANFDTQHYSILPLPSDPFVAIVPSHWEQYAGETFITPEELARHPFLTLKTDQTTGMHERVMSEFRSHGVLPSIICECSSVVIIIALVASGLGATILPKSVMASSLFNNVRMLDMEQANFQSDVGIVWLKERYLSRSARNFIDSFTE
ncbi:LysR family transcriptional regulator [Paenibacillus sp. GCM10012307]|uniref:LysR family transcriptional regulator n=1 Tax=Paenibacillus roseus TaxID=2798579 RepID=A0A934MSJ9_9BACL|nr:LysR family transcriptional regulator [Paenibacillus roseus]MBJ6364013.1 LysR family transcriptional regulator [Paenibacillus roseus]